MPMNPNMTRRRLIGAGAAVGAASLLPMGLLSACTAPAKNGSWQNWSGFQKSKPSAWLKPTSEAELIVGLNKSFGPLRITGAGHSFSALCKTNDTLISIDELSGVISHDAATQQATIWAGSRLHDLGEPLWARGQSFCNQGDVDVQSLAGACGTSTHGTGSRLGSFSAQVRGVRLVTPSGEILEANAQNQPDLLKAASTSLGVLGVVTQLTMQNQAAYHLQEHEFIEPVEAVLNKIDDYAKNNRHAEFWVFFEGDQAIVKLLNETTVPDTEPPMFDLPVSSVLDLSSRIAHGIPGMDGPMQSMLLALHSEVRRSGRAYRIFPSDRDSRFNEMEYEIPVEQGPECLQEILATVRRSGLRTLFPVEYRLVAADDVWLSPFYQRDSAAISVHQHVSTDHRPLFELVEPIFWKYGGRPHWGKLHSLKARQLAELYPRWDDFQRLRKQLDPQGRMLNEHLRSVLLT